MTTDAFLGELDRKYRRQVERYVLRRSADIEPEEVWGYVLRGAWRRGVTAEYFDSEQHERNWVFRLAAQACTWIARTRKARRREALLGGMGWLATVPCCVDRDPPTPRAERMRRCLDAMSPKARDVVLMRICQDMRSRDVQKLLGCSSSLVAGNVKQGLKELRLRFEGAYRDRWGRVFDPAA